MNVRRVGVFKRLLRRLRRNERAAIVVEFALVLPVLIMIFVGMAEFTEAFTVMRKLAQSAGTVSDLVAQETTVTSSTLANIRLIAEEIMKPYSPPNSLVIVSVVSDGANTVRVAWSDPPIYAQDQIYSLPNDKLTEPNSGLIVTEATYNFTPTLSYFLLGNFTLQERAFFRPAAGRPSRRRIEIARADRFLLHTFSHLRWTCTLIIASQDALIGFAGWRAALDQRIIAYSHAMRATARLAGLRRLWRGRRRMRSEASKYKQIAMQTLTQLTRGSMAYAHSCPLS